MDPLEFLKLVEEEVGGQRRQIYKDQIAKGLRFGQAFMNALRGSDYYDQLTGSLADPFYKYGYDDIVAAINYLMEKK